ncbi:MAG TPA: fatty acyl-AMP ligase [Nevskiaceae bacterium]|nr:fatty acyl-AMP ligase [Nevskiaceae bacterium]
MNGPERSGAARLGATVDMGCCAMSHSIRHDTTPTITRVPSHPTTLAAALDHAAQTTNALRFYSGRGRLQSELSYAELRNKAREAARRLLATGLAAGDRVCLIAATDPGFVQAFFACQYARLVPVPLPLPLALRGRGEYVEHLRRMIVAAQADAVLGPSSFAGWFEEASAPLSLRFVGTLEQLPLPSEGEPAELPPPTPDALAYLQFSSGSTRFPRGVAVTQRAVMANTLGIVRDGLRATPQDRCVSWLPLYHDMGLVGFLLAPVSCQLSVDYLPTHEFARRPLVWLDLISRNYATLSYGAPFGYELCVKLAEHGLLEGLDLSSWRVAGIGGDMIRPAVLRRFAEVFAPAGFDPRAFVASYGMAEASLALSFAPLQHGLQTDCVDAEQLERRATVTITTVAGQATTRTREFVHCGPILPEHEVEIRDAHGHALGERVVGTIHVRGPSLMREYFGDQAETARVLGTDGWLDTGDLGYLNKGEIVITGRAKDLIVLNGRNVWPQDLEWTLEASDEALRSGGIVAFGVSTEQGERVVALCECRTLDADAKAALTSRLSGTLAQRYGIEVRVVLVPSRALPRTSSGKLSRSKAKRQYLEGQFARSDDPAR